MESQDFDHHPAVSRPPPLQCQWSPFWGARTSIPTHLHSQWAEETPSLGYQYGLSGIFSLDYYPHPTTTRGSLRFASPAGSVRESQLIKKVSVDQGLITQYTAISRFLLETTLHTINQGDLKTE